jgi:hypothetical protein
VSRATRRRHVMMSTDLQILLIVKSHSRVPLYSCTKFSTHCITNRKVPSSFGRRVWVQTDLFSTRAPNAGAAAAARQDAVALAASHEQRGGAAAAGPPRRGARRPPRGSG